MGSLFDSLMSDCASPMLDQHFGEAVSITRGSNTTTGVTASWKSQDAVVDTTNRTGTEIVDRFWFVKASLYSIASSAVKPRTGDRLTDGAGNVWEVLPSKTVPTVESYGDGTYWRISTKQVT